MADENKQAAPYLPFKTFLSALEAFSHGVPPIIDRSIWRTQPGGIQGLIMGALRFFNLIDETNRPTSALHRLALGKDKRQEHVRALLEYAYAGLVRHDLTKMTSKMLDDAIEQYGVSGETKKKAVTFFLQAAKYADMPLSPFLQGQIRATPGTRKKRTVRREIEESATSTIIVRQNQGNTSSIELDSGGSVCISVTFDAFTISEFDRQFVFELIDKLRGYENRKRSAAAIAKGLSDIAKGVGGGNKS